MEAIFEYWEMYRVGTFIGQIAQFADGTTVIRCFDPNHEPLTIIQNAPFMLLGDIRYDIQNRYDCTIISAQHGVHV